MAGGGTRQLKVLPPHGDLNLKNAADAKFTDCEFWCKSALMYAPFMETGRQGGVPFQPRGNHRMLRLNSFHEETYDQDNFSKKEQKPLMDSAIYPGDSEAKRFDQGHYMSFSAYEVAPCADVTKVPSHERVSSCADVVVPWEEPEPKCRPSVIEGMKVTEISKEGFKRTLEVYGLKREDESKEVSQLEVLRFLRYISRFSIATRDEMKYFMTEVIPGLYQYDENADHATNVRRLCQLLRSLCSFRVFLYEGQHRFQVLKCIGEGFFKICEVYPENGEIEYSTIEEAQPTLPNCFQLQFFKDKTQEKIPLNIRIGFLKVDHGLEHRLDCFRKYGSATASANNMNVLSTYQATMLEFLEFFEQKSLIEKLDPIDPMLNLVYKNYWKTPGKEVLGAMKGNNMKLNQYFVDFIKERNKDGLFCPQQMNLPELVKILNYIAASDNYIAYPLSDNARQRLKINKTKSGSKKSEGERFDKVVSITNGTEVFLALLCAVLKYGEVTILRDFFRGQFLNSRREQVPIQGWSREQRKDAVTSMKWIKHNILCVAFNTKNLIYERAVVEISLVHRFWNEERDGKRSPDDPLNPRFESIERARQALRDGEEVKKFSNLDIDFFDGIEYIPPFGEINFGKLSVQGLSSLKTKIEASVMRVIVKELLHCVNKYGLSPKMKAWSSGEHRNIQYELYTA